MGGSASREVANNPIRGANPTNGELGLVHQPLHLFEFVVEVFEIPQQRHNREGIEPLVGLVLGLEPLLSKVLSHRFPAHWGIQVVVNSKLAVQLLGHSLAIIRLLLPGLLRSLLLQRQNEHLASVVQLCIKDEGPDQVPNDHPTQCSGSQLTGG